MNGLLFSPGFLTCAVCIPFRFFFVSFDWEMQVPGSPLSDGDAVDPEVWLLPFRHLFSAALIL